MNEAECATIICEVLCLKRIQIFSDELLFTLTKALVIIAVSSLTLL